MKKPNDETTTKAGFKISGEFICGVARERLLEGDWRYSMKLLESVNGLTMEQQLQILKGQKYLSGVNDLDLIDDTREETKEYQQNLQKQMSSLMYFNNRFYKPYAYIDSWCSDDLPGLSQGRSAQSHRFTEKYNPEISASSRGEHPLGRSLYYADDGHNDLAVAIDASKGKKLKKFFNKVVLFKTLDAEPPFFLESMWAKDPFSCLENARFLEKRGSPEDSLGLPLEKLRATLFEDKTGKKLAEPPMGQSEDDYWLKYEQKVENYRKAVMDYANNDKEYGWMTLVHEDGQTLKVPARALLHYALGVALSTHPDKKELLAKLPPYKAFCEGSLKMANDDPMHSDAWIGTGLKLEDAYAHDKWQTNLFLQAAYQMQEKYLDYQFHLLSRGGKAAFSGTTCNPYNYQEVEKGKRILVLPHLGIEFEQVAMQCDAIITQQGGPLAHLVVVGKELNKNWPIIRVDNACLVFAVSASIHVDLLEGKIKPEEAHEVVKPAKPRAR